ncbi:MAG: TaqI-like C-terminal specificity domain-containing protein, partial [Ignavibacteriaceae bacterium]|nr:TaqI-like C-terminal specificity domain-containing protein [Ignavibacteriaceae bacterium]
DNIKSGNSLIDTDFYDTELDFGEDRKVKPFNWQNAFPNVFAKGGFDAIIGNPPYIQAKIGQLNEAEIGYFFNHYTTAEYQINTYGLFIECAFKLINSIGRIGFIIPNYWLSTEYDKKLRKFLFQNNHVLELNNVFKVFESAVVDTLVIIAKKNERSSSPKSTKVRAIDRNIKSIDERLNKFSKNEWAYNKLIITDDSKDDISLSFRETTNLRVTNQLKDYFTLNFGAKLYQVGKGKPPQKSKDSKNKLFESDYKVDGSYVKLLRARHVKKYNLKWDKNWVKYGIHLAEPRSMDLFSGDRILIQRIVSNKYLDAVFVKEVYICNTDIITLKPIKDNIDCRFFLGIINSKLCVSYVKSNNVNLDRDAFPKINTKTLKSFPVPEYNAVELNQRNEIIKNSDNLLKLYKEKQSATLQTQIDQIQSRIDYHEDKINLAVYQLYNLTAEEIKIVEDSIS